MADGGFTSDNRVQAYIRNGTAAQSWAPVSLGDVFCGMDAAVAADKELLPVEA